MFQLTDEIRETIHVSDQQGSLPSVWKVSWSLGFSASGSFQDACGEM